MVGAGLTNAVRHGRATEAWVSLRCAEEDGVPIALHAQVRNKGQGFDMNQRSSGGWGLRNMQRRAEQLGGALRIEGRPGAETVVDLTVPLRAATAPDPSQLSGKQALRR